MTEPNQGSSLAAIFRTAKLHQNWLALVLITVLLFNNAGQAWGQSTNAATITGTFSIIQGDPEPSSGGRHITLYQITDSKGATYALDFGAAVLPVGGILKLDGQSVKLSGAIQTNQASSVIKVQTIELDKTAPPVSRNVIGTQKFYSILCKFSDIATEPRDLAFFNTQLGTSRPGFNHYFQEMSFGRLNLNGSQAFGWFTLPGTRSSYMSLPTATQRLSKLAQDCTAVADATVDFSGAFGLNFMFNGELDNAAWGGSRFMTLDGVTKSWRTTWMPYYEGDTFGWLEHGILAHEMGHAFGAPHTTDSKGYQYGNSWDAVSNPQAGCYFSSAYPTPIPNSIDPAYGCLGQQVTGALKEVMGFYDSAKILNYTGSSPQTIQLERQAIPPGVVGTYLLIKIQSPTNSAISYSIESRFRTPGSYDTKTRGDGVIIYRTNENLSNQTSDITWLYPPPGATNDSERCNGSICGVGAAQAIWPVGSMLDRSADDGVKLRIDAYSADGTATITINPVGGIAPNITTQPQDKTITSGNTASLSVTASGTAPLAYQWYQGVSGNTTTPVGINSANFTTPALSATTSYWVRVSNDAGSVNSNTATVTVNTLPTITQQPKNKLIATGQATTLNVIASGTAPLSYQWFRGNAGDITNPVGTNSANYTTPTLNATTSYWVRVSNGVGIASSNTATVTVAAPPVITTNPSDEFIPSGQTVTLNVIATGAAPLSYQWYRGDSGDTSWAVGTNSPSFTTPALLLTTNYWVRVTNAVGQDDSTTANVEVAPQNPLEVTLSTDAGIPGSSNTPGTLTYALLNADPGQAIVFNLPNGEDTVNVTGPLPAPTNGPILLDGGNCNNGPSTTITWTGSGGATGLTFSKNVTLQNLAIRGFSSVQLRVLAGVFSGGPCIVVSRN